MKKIDRVIWINKGWQPIPIGFSPSKEAWEREARKFRIYGDPPKAAEKGGHCAFLENDVMGDAIILVSIHNGADRNTTDMVMTLMHEAVHVWQFVCEKLGETAPGREMEAYGIEHITRGLIGACFPQGLKHTGD